ncbi:MULTISPECIES: DUF3899 domain-containing protein [Vagococcus]|uniref:DUF3899 domain-containing protein n=1 Tax=Vagococcus TaxID=2737 RepID=UPI00056FA066|nr:MULTISPECIES: DUF3899 domain-containing protein [Vagococcus]NKZ28316.1 hypothetical protein [Vagococcus lutrae]
MQKFRLPIVTNIFFLMLITLISVIKKEEITIMLLSDRLFLFGLFTLMISAFIQIVRSGFIDNFQKSFHQRSKKKKYSYVSASQWFQTKPVVLFATSVVSFLLSFLLLVLK